MRILNAAQMREADRYTIHEIGIPSLVLMENAGRQVVAAMEAGYESRLEGRVAVLCGNIKRRRTDVAEEVPAEADVWRIASGAALLADRGVAVGADLLGDVALVHRRLRIGALEDLVLAVAVGARGGVEVALAQCQRVRAVVEFGRGVLMAFRAGLGDVQLVHPRIGDHRAVHLVRAVAVDAVGRVGLAVLERGAVDALLERRDEFRPAQRLAGDGLLLHVA